MMCCNGVARCIALLVKNRDTPMAQDDELSVAGTVSGDGTTLGRDNRQ